MLLRTGSIFHFEEEDEGGEGEREKEAINGGFLSRETAGKGLVGLQILISKQELQGANNNVVIKPLKKICKKPEMISVDFLKFCFLCSKELSLHEEVYMYSFPVPGGSHAGEEEVESGDQGFCSVECRNKQIVQDERREFSAATRPRFRVPNLHHIGSKIQESNGRSKITVSA